MRARRRSAALAAATCFMLGAGLLLPTSVATAELPDGRTTEPAVEVMDEYAPSDYVDEAAALPDQLIESLERDVDQTGEEYLAQADAAVQAVEVVDSLEAVGVEVLGSRLEETTLVVNVETAADAEVVESAGAVAEIGAPDPFELDGVAVELAADVYDGQGYFWNDGTFNYQCSVGFHGYTEFGGPEFVTAGHCMEGSTDMGADGIIDGYIRTLDLPSPGQASVPTNHGSPIGLEAPSTRMFGPSADGFDVARVAVNYPGTVAKPSVLTWGYGGGAPFSTPRATVTGMAAPIDGATLCRSGSRSGWRCGPIVAVDYVQPFDPDDVAASGDEFDIVSVVANLCAIPGDSGGSALMGTRAVGITSWTTNPFTCLSSDFSGYFQMISPGGLASVSSAYGSGWELAVSVPTPVITSPAGGATAINPTAISGTLSGASSENTVTLYLDGSTLAFATVDASSGTWTVPLTGVAPGLHTFSVTANYGDFNKSAAATGAFAVDVTIDRIAGIDRYDTGIQVAAAGAAAPLPVLFVTTGQNYPDALSAGPAAVHLGGSLMLVQPGGLSQAVMDAIADLQPAKIYVLGAENSVSANAFNQIAAAVPAAAVVRLTGVDRYDTSRLIARTAFITDVPGGSTTLYVSNGGNFPDALSAGGAAATVGAPVLMVPGSSSSVPAATLQLIQDLGVTDIVVTGGSNSVSDGIYTQLANLPATVSIERQTGIDRYATSVAINAASFVPTEDRALLATGSNYPDALAGSALAGTLGGPLYIAPGTCILPSTFNDLVRLKVTHLTLLGGLPSLSSSVANLTRC